MVLRRNSTLDDHYVAIGLNLSASGHAVQYSHSLPGYHARFDNETQLAQARADPNVLFVEHNSIISASYFNHTATDNIDSPTGVPLARREWQAAVSSPFWQPYTRPMMSTPPGEKLDTLVQDGSENQFLQYEVDNILPSTGVDIYILDTGIALGHLALGGRATNFQGSDTSSSCPGEIAADNEDHGTAVVGSAGSLGFRTAEGSNLINVKILCENE